MNCLRCGKEIPEGELLCPECRTDGEQYSAAQEPAGSAEPELPADPLPVTLEEQEAAFLPEEPEMLPGSEEPTIAFAPVSVPEEGIEPEEDEEEPEPRPKKKKKKKKNKLTVPFILVAVLLLAALIYIVRSYTDITRTKNRYKVKEAGVDALESTIEEKDAEISELNAEIGHQNQTIGELERSVADLQNSLKNQQSSASQSTYDYNALQNRITILETEKADLQNQYDGLLQTNQEVRDESRRYRQEAKTARDDREKMQKEYDEMKEDVEKLQKEYDEYKAQKKKDDEKLKFVDTYVVFVNNDGSEYYHKYDCSKFTKSNFWAYSVKLAENNGYKPCPECCK